MSKLRILTQMFSQPLRPNFAQQAFGHIGWSYRNRLQDTIYVQKQEGNTLEDQLVNHVTGITELGRTWKMYNRHVWAPFPPVYLFSSPILVLSN